MNFYDFLQINYKKQNNNSVHKNKKQDDFENQYYLQKITQELLKEDNLVHKDSYRKSNK